MKTINSHLHSRIAQLKAKAIKLGLIISCDRIDWPGYENHYVVLKPDQIAHTEHTTVATAVILLQLIKSVEDSNDSDDSENQIE